MAEVTIGGMTAANRALKPTDLIEIEDAGGNGYKLTGQEVIDLINYSDFITVGGPSSVTLTNPLATVIRVEFNAPGLQLRMPVMNAVNSRQKGDGPVLIFSETVHDFALCKNDGTVIHPALKVNQWLVLSIQDNLDANGGFKYFVHGTLGWQQNDNVNIDGGFLNNVFIGDIDPAILGRLNLLKTTEFNPGKSFPRQAVKATTTSNLTATYNNGSSGIGATLTNSGAQSALVLDGYACQINDRVLIKDQTTQSENGIYIVTLPGSPSTNWFLTRTTDFDNSLGGEITQGVRVLVCNGTINGDQEFYQTNNNTIVIGMTAITFAPTYLLKQISGTHNTTWRGLWAVDSTGNIAYTLLPNNRVRLKFPEVIKVGDGSIDKVRNNTLLPTFLRPPAGLPVEAVIRTQVNGSPVVNSYGLLLIEPSGQISIAADASNADFPGSTFNTGFHPVEVEYNVV